MRRVTLLFLFLPLAGCIETQICGSGFTDEAGRCVPANAAPHYYSTDAPIDASGVTLRDARAARDLVAWPDGGAAGEDDFNLVLIVDLASDAEARRDPESPGFDLDAVALIRGRERIAFGGRVVSYVLNRPGERNRWVDPLAVIGPPDDIPASLGAGGGHIAIEWDSGNTSQAGDFVEVTQAAVDREGPYSVSLCRRSQPVSPRDCLPIGRAQGSGQFVVPF